MIILNIFLLLAGFFILIKGSEIFVDGASSIAGNLKVSTMLIGLTIVTFGTSAPELAVSFKSIISGNGDITIGNIIGSNIINNLLIIGVCALIHSLYLKHTTIKRELPIAILITTIFVVVMSDSVFDPVENTFTRSDGIILFITFMIFIYYLYSMMHLRVEDDQSKDYLPMKKAILYTFCGIIALLLGSDFVVDSAVYLAETIGISERLIAMTIIALGTGLPELVTSITATKKGEYDLVIGNVVGSNIFNIALVIGLPVSIFGGIGTVNFNLIDLGILLLSVVLLFAFSVGDRKISKYEGVIFLMIFTAYYSYIILRG